MTIAMCHLSNEGVVLGADSTATLRFQDPNIPVHYFHHEQKLFEIGENSTLAIVTWGLGGGFAGLSYRGLVAQLADEMQLATPKTVGDVARKWVERCQPLFQIQFAKEIQEFSDLSNRDPSSLKPEETARLQQLGYLNGGFCVGGYLMSDRRPEAHEVTYSLGKGGAFSVSPLDHNQGRFWGCPNVLDRIFHGTSRHCVDKILSSGNWNATRQELVTLLHEDCLVPPAPLPLRDAIDFVFSSIYTTIKTFKFSNLPQICGGPIELGVISADRRFRWVSHKGLDEAISHRPYNQRPILRS